MSLGPFVVLKSIFENLACEETVGIDAFLHQFEQIEVEKI